MRLGYIHSMKGSLIALVVFAVAAWLIPGQEKSDYVELLLTVSAFLFGILAGFYMTRANHRYDLVRELIAEEDADWLSFYESAKFFDPELREQLRELLDEYYIRAMDVDSMKYYKQTRATFKKIHAALHLAKPNDFPVIAYMAELLANIEKTRNKTSVVVSERLLLGQWLTLIILSFIILYCLFYLKQPILYSYVTTVLLSTVLVMILLVIRDLVHLRLGGELVAVESGEEMFELINKPRYYNQKLLQDKSASVPESVSLYRLGKHTPGASVLEIELVKREI